MPMITYDDNIIQIIKINSYRESGAVWHISLWYETVHLPLKRKWKSSRRFLFPVTEWNFLQKWHFSKMFQYSLYILGDSLIWRQFLYSDRQKCATLQKKLERKHVTYTSILYVKKITVKHRIERYQKRFLRNILISCDNYICACILHKYRIKIRRECRFVQCATFPRLSLRLTDKACLFHCDDISFIQSIYPIWRYL